MHVVLGNVFRGGPVVILEYSEQKEKHIFIKKIWKPRRGSEVWLLYLEMWMLVCITYLYLLTLIFANEQRSQMQQPWLQ